MLWLKMKQHCKKVSVLADCLHHSDDGFAVSDDELHQTSVTTHEYSDYHMKNIRLHVQKLCYKRNVTVCGLGYYLFHTL